MLPAVVNVGSPEDSVVPSHTVFLEVRGHGPSPILSVSLLCSKGRGCDWASGRRMGHSLAQPLMLLVSAQQPSTCPCHGDLL